MKKILIFIMVGLLFFVALSCAKKGGDDEQTTPIEEVPEEVTVDLLGEGSYDIIVGEGAFGVVGDTAFSLYKKIAELTGKRTEIVVKDDFVRNPEDAANDKLEILLGITNRPESAEAADSLPTYLDYTIKVTDNKIAIFAHDVDRLAEAVEDFYGRLSYSDGRLVYTNDRNYLKSYENYQYSPLMLGGAELPRYTIIVPSDAGEAEMNFARELSILFGKTSGHLPEIAEDNREIREYEILIGETNREAGRDAIGDTTGLGHSGYIIRALRGTVVLYSGSSRGYRLIVKELEAMLEKEGGTLAAGDELIVPDDIKSLDGKRVMFVGNSFTYYGECVYKSTVNGTDKGYFHQISKLYGDNVTVTNFAYPSAILWRAASGAVDETSLYSRMLLLHPNHYNNSAGKQTDSFYNQDYVIIQQAGSKISYTYDDAKAIMALFPPTTEFFFYITNHDISSNHTPTLEAARGLRDEGVKYIPVGHLVFNLWKGTEKIEGSSLTYNKNTFIVSKTSSDGYHPNYLTGYITALMTYCTITGNSAQAVVSSFVNTSKNHYTYNGAISNFDMVLKSEHDMNAICDLINSYLRQYNP